MNSVDLHARSARLMGAVFLCLAAVAAPVAAGACDMNAVDQQLARLVQATPQAVAANTAADPSSKAVDPSPNALQGGQSGAPSIGAVPQQTQEAANLAKN